MFVFLFKLRLVRLVVRLIKRFSLSQALPSSSFSLYLLYLGVYCRRTTKITLQVSRYLHNRRSAVLLIVPSPLSEFSSRSLVFLTEYLRRCSSISFYIQLS